MVILLVLTVFLVIFSFLEDESFNGLDELTSLRLDHNDLSTLTPSVFNSLKNLMILDLSYNKLTYLPRDVFAEQKELERVMLQNNNIQVMKIYSTIFCNICLKLVAVVHSISYVSVCAQLILWYKNKRGQLQ